jgi:gliding motility-associated-like protein
MKLKIIFIALFILIGNIGTLRSQSFTNVNGGIVATVFSASAWGDYDNDGDIDLIQTGSPVSTVPFSQITKIYRNDGNGLFADINTDVIGINSGSVDWGDYDNDKDLDILITGNAGINNLITRIYRNDGNDVFIDINAGLSGADSSCAKWGDYDNDGYLDIAIIGQGGEYYDWFMTKIYHNNKNGTFTNINASFIVLDETTYGIGALAWGDTDNDGDLDLLISADSYQGPQTMLYRNDGLGLFIDVGQFEGLLQGAIAFGDYDNDNDLDILITGLNSNGKAATLYQNVGNNHFIPAVGFNFGVDLSSVDWGDYDNDCDLDILICGARGTVGTNSNGNRTTRIFRNNGNGLFTEDVSLNLNGVSACSSVFGDYDNDGDLDIFISGGNNTSFMPVAMLYRNNLDPIIQLANDDIYTDTCINSTITFDVLTNDLDSDGDSSSNFSILSVKHGTAVILPNKKIQYTPNELFISRDTIIYKICYKYCPRACDTAIVVICRTCPTAPITIDDIITTCLNGCTETLLIDVLKNDSNTQNTYPTILNTNAIAGNASIQNKSIQYSPDYNYTGTTYITYSLCNNSCPSLCDTASISICLDPIKIFIPNLVTYNNDGLNDYFAIMGLCSGSKLSISNRWGEIVYTSNDYKNDWTGENLSEGIYYYNIESLSGNKTWKGWVQLIK